LEKIFTTSANAWRRSGPARPASSRADIKILYIVAEPFGQSNSTAFRNVSSDTSQTASPRLSCGPRIGSDRSQSGHAGFAVNQPQMTQSGARLCIAAASEGVVPQSTTLESASCSASQPPQALFASASLSAGARPQPRVAMTAHGEGPGPEEFAKGSQL
jgi:hypothetical protein